MEISQNVLVSQLNFTLRSKVVYRVTEGGYGISTSLLLIGKNVTNMTPFTKKITMTHHSHFQSFQTSINYLWFFVLINGVLEHWSIVVIEKMLDI